MSLGEKDFIGAANYVFLWMHENSILSYGDINPPASHEGISILDEIYTGKVPDELKAIYRIHDGQTGASNGIFAGYYFMSIREIIEAQALAVSFYEDTTLNKYAKSLIAEEILPTFVHPERLSFASSGGGNFLAIDLKPGDKGTVGQVINCGRDDSIMQVLSYSFSDFLIKYAYLLRNDRIKPVLDEDLGTRLDCSPYDNLIQLMASN